MDKRTIEEEIEFYSAQKVMRNVYVGTENISGGFMVISKEDTSFTSTYVPHYAITAISKLKLR